MENSTRKTRTRRKPANDGPTEEELMQAAIAIEVEETVSKIINNAQLDRMMLTRVSAVVVELVGATCTDHPLPSEVQTILYDTIKAGLERVDRICNNDRPTYQVCQKCGE